MIYSTRIYSTRIYSNEIYSSRIYSSTIYSSRIYSNVLHCKGKAVLCPASRESAALVSDDRYSIVMQRHGCASLVDHSSKPDSLRDTRSERVSDFRCNGHRDLAKLPYVTDNSLPTRVCTV